MLKRKIKVEDLRRFKFVSDPQVSLDGKNVAFVLSTINSDKDRYERRIWMADIGTGKIFQFTHGPGSDTYPRWSPDGGSLFFLSREREPEKKTQLYNISLAGGEAQLLAETEEGISKPVWAPNSKDALFLSKVWEDKKPETDVKVIKRIRHKHNLGGFFNGKRTHLFTARQGKKVKQITIGSFDIDMATWSPNGKTISFVSNMDEDADTSHVRDIFTIPASGGDPEKLTNGEYSITSISYSPNGEFLSFIGHDQPHELAVDYDLWLIDINSCEKRNITENFNRSLMQGVGSDLRVSTPNPGAVWSRDGENVYFVTADTPFSNVYWQSIVDGSLHVVVSGKVVDGFSLSQDSSLLAFNALSSTSPAELWIKTDQGEVKLSNFNDPLLKKLDLVEPEHFTFTNRLGRTVDGWIIKPADFNPKKKYPCVLEMHGGPRSIYGDSIFQEFQLLSADGFAVIYTNPRGSAGYEEEYTQAVMRHYGEVDLEDFMDFTEEALRRYTWIDEDRMGLTGGSYGGYTTNWIISQTDRFKAAVTCRSICNWVSKFGVSDIGFMQPESISGYKTYWGDAITEQLKHSPIYYVDQVKTPCLIIHSELDYRCPIDQAEQWFTALKLNGVQTELIRFPDENHELSRSGKPKHREERFNHILRWFREYLKP